MSKSLKNILFAVAGLIGLLVLIFAVLFFVVDTSVYKPWLERVASEALGMEVHVGGRLKISPFPDLHIGLDDVHIRNRATEVASAKEAVLDIDLFSLLRKEVRIKRIGLQGARISILRGGDGLFNFEKHNEAKETSLALILDNLSLTDGAFLYRDEQSGEGFEAGNFNLNLSSLRITGRNSMEILKNLSFTAGFSCREIRTKHIIYSDVKFTGRGQDGIIAIHPVTLRLFGGQGSMSIEANFSDSVPRYSVRSSLSKFRIEEYFKTISSKKVAGGAMDFSASLSMQGKTLREIKRTTDGEISLRGENLTLYGNDLDREFARYESSQNFNLIDVGAFFFAGPLGLAVTKGYNFASIFQGSGGSSIIRTLFSSWKVEHGIAQAREVVMATPKNRIALQGRINFVDERFDEVTIALIDARGCARVKQKIHGPFHKPVVEKPNVLISIAGPVLNLLRQTRDVFTGGKCEAFYTGSVAAPK